MGKRRSIYTSIRPVHNDLGMTLIELVVATALTVVVSMLAVSALLLMNTKSGFVKDSAEFEDNYLLLKSTLPFYLGQAIDVDWTDSAITDIGNGRGRLRIFNSSFSPLRGANVPDPIPVGIYLREAARPNATTTGSRIRATGLYFRPPTRHTPGELMMVSSDGRAGSVTLDPANAGQKFGPIVEFEIRPSSRRVEGPGDAVRSARLRMVFRKYFGGEKRDQRWCPRAQMRAGLDNCETRAAFRDVERTVDVALINNVIETEFFDATVFTSPVPRKETLYGDLYFFRARIR